jgi:endonuclease YncB( thermonuclease family)
VTVETDKTDKYGRLVGKILLPTGQDVNLEQVARGLAWHYKEYQMEQSTHDRAIYDAAEIRARRARRGLWADTDPMPPWEFRHKGK